MFDRSWIPSSLREFINERVLKRKPLRNLSPSGPKNPRELSLPIQANRQMLDGLVVEDDGKQVAEPAHEEKWKRKPLPMLPSHVTTASTLPADNPLGVTISSTTTSDLASQEDGSPTAMAFHPGNENRVSRVETLNAFASFFEDDDDNDFKPDLHVPVRASELTNSTDWPDHAILLCNPAFLTRLTDLLKIRKAYEKAQRDANLIKPATDTFSLKLKMEITKTEIRLHRFYPDVRLAKQYNVYDNATSGPSATALKLERKLRELRSFLERAVERCAATFTALEQQAQNLRAAQDAVNADLEKAFADADMLGGEISAEPDGAQASDVIGEYRAFCHQNGIKWDGGEGKKLPASLRVGPVVEEIDGKDVFKLA